jgi:RimJ/RimL family protein N-acetyltransferase
VISSQWDRAVPDVPRWVEVRSMLLHDEATVFGDPSGGVVVGSDGFTIGIVGRPDVQVFERARGLFAPDAEALVGPEDLDHGRALLPDGRPRRAILHRLPTAFSDAPAAPATIVEVDAGFLSSLPAELAIEVEGSYLAAFREIDGLVVSVCGAASITESLWDVGIDTLEGYRRQGYARDCYTTLADHLAVQGQEPVWGAYDDNVPSLALAASLGFTPVDELWVIETAVS